MLALTIGLEGPIRTAGVFDSSNLQVVGLRGAAQGEGVQMISWDLWHTIEEIAFTGSYVGAAKRLGVDATTVRRRLDILERALGRQLFRRQSRLLTPTPACRLALDEVRVAGKHLDAARNRLAPEFEHSLWRKIRITSVPFLCERVWGPSIKLLPEDQRLRIELDGHDRNLDLTNEREADRSADIALRLGPTADKGISTWHIGEIEYATYISKHAEAEGCPWVTLDRFHSHLKEVRLAEEFEGVERVRYTVTTTTAVESIIKASAAKGILPKFAAEENSELVVLEDHPTFTRPLWIMWHDDVTKEAHFRAIVTWILGLTSSHFIETPQARELLAKFGEAPLIAAKG